MLLEKPQWDRRHEENIIAVGKLHAAMANKAVVMIRSLAS